MPTFTVATEEEEFVLHFWPRKEVVTKNFDFEPSPAEWGGIDEAEAGRNLERRVRLKIMRT